MGLLDKITGRQELLDLINQLRRELRELKQTRIGTSKLLSIAGIEDGVLQVGADDLIAYANAPMKLLLGVEDGEPAGRRVTEVDALPWGPGLLGYLVEEVRRTQQEVSRDREYLDPATGKEVFLTVRALPVEPDRVQVLVQDRTTFERYRRAFERCVGPHVLRKMVESDKDFFKADRCRISILFADMRGFTALCETQSPEAVRTALNEYLEAMIDVLDRHEATLDKVAGDEIMAVFGAPMAMADHAARAVACACDMQAAHDGLMLKWQREGKEPPPMGIGINTGEVVAGFVGTRKRAEYTVLGHAVNVASRLCDRAAGGQVLVTRATLDALLASTPRLGDTTDFRLLGKIQVRGVSEPVEIYDARRKGATPRP